MPDVPIDCSTFTSGSLIRPAFLELGRQFDVWHPCVYKAKGQPETQWKLLITAASRAERTHLYHSYFLTSQRPRFMLQGDPLHIQAPPILFFNLRFICRGEGFGDGDLHRGTGQSMYQYKVDILLCRENKNAENRGPSGLFSYPPVCKSPWGTTGLLAADPQQTMRRVILWAPPAQDVPSPAPRAVGLKPELWKPLYGATWVGHDSGGW